MTHQTAFTIVAAIRPGQHAALETLLAAHCISGQPGHADPANSLIDFAALPTLHNIRAVILDDPSLGDRAIHPGAWPEERLQFTLLGCADGEEDDILSALAATSAPGLAAMFAHLEGFTGDVLAFMRAQRVDSIAVYTNGPGRTVMQVREEAALATALRDELAKLPPAPPLATATALRAAIAARRLPLSPPLPVPLARRLNDFASLISVPLLAIAALFWLPLLALPLAIIAIVLRRRERTDPTLRIAPDPQEIARRSAYEDHDTANPFTAMGTIKPGLFRLGLVHAVHFVIDWGARWLFRGGRLGRVGSIHFARWVLIDRGRRVVFTSEYDGFAEGYMDDFINKVAFGLNASFSNGIGYPRTDWLVLNGASDEQAFKYFMRHHQIVTQWWWRACPGLTTLDLARHTRLRRGYEAAAMDDLAARRWLAEIR